MISKTLKLFVICVLLPINACTSRVPSENEKQEPVIVHVFRNSSNQLEPWFSQVTSKFNSIGIRTTSGRLIRVATVESEYRSTIPKLGAAIKPDLIILDLREDSQLNPLLVEGAGGAESLCKTENKCLAFIPQWVPNEDRNATRQLLEYLKKSIE